MALSKAKALQEAEKLVAQGKTALAIKQYLQIFEQDPTDFILLNTAGDLYVREKNVSAALKLFNQLADTYVHEGFTVKAIAIYKKITKLDSNSPDPILKLAELYTLQGLARDAREQYTHAVEFYRKKNQPEKIVDLLRKIVKTDPENATHRARLAEFCEQAGRKADAIQAYVESAQLALRHGESATVELALKKASALDPKNSQVALLKARMALATRRPEEVEKILAPLAALKDNAEAHDLLLEAHLATNNLEVAEKLVVDAYHANPGNLSLLATYAGLCVERGEFDSAVKLLTEVADDAIERKNGAPLVEALKHVLAKMPNHIPTLKLLLSVCERTADEFTLPEVLEALGRAYMQSGDLEQAEAIYDKLVKREPANEHFKGLVREVRQKLGKEVTVPSPATFSGVEMALTPAAETKPAAPVPPAAEVDRAAMVKEALDNSDLFSRYGLSEKAIGELEKVLEVYPDQIEIHQRIMEISHSTDPARAAQAQAELDRLAAAPPAPGTAPEFNLSSDLPLGGEPAAAPSAQEIPLDFPTAAPESPPASAAQTLEIDLSTDFAASARRVPPPAPATFNYEEARVEIEFYLEQGFADEAQKSVAGLEEKFPGNPQIAELRQRVEIHGAAAPAARPSAAPPEPERPEVAPPQPSVAGPVAAGPASRVVPPSAPRRQAPAPGADMLSSLASDLAANLDGLQASASPPAAHPAAPASSATPLSGLLEELGEPGGAAAGQEDPETHYNLGVAFREMGLLDEAIGEFQKVVKDTPKGKFPAHFLQACTLLAASFMDKKMPAIAAKWYARALEMPDLDDEATLALQYDLGVAFEQSGENRTALEKFTEVYTRNIDYRDVAEKIRLLQQKGS